MVSCAPSPTLPACSRRVPVMPLFTTILPTTPNRPALNQQLAMLARAHSRVMAAVLGAVRPGVTPAGLADVAREQAQLGGITLTMGAATGFPDDITVGLNAHTMNAVPSRSKQVKDGDTVKIAVRSTDGAGACCVQHWSMQAGTLMPQRRVLLENTRACIDDAVAWCRPGVALSALVAQLTASAAARGIFISPEFAGHMIGAETIMPPMIVKPKSLFGTDHVLVEGTVLSLFVLAHEHKAALTEAGDGWGVVDRQRGMSAAFSHVVQVADVPQVLTAAYPLHA